MAYVERLQKTWKDWFVQSDVTNMPSDGSNLCEPADEGELYQYQGSIKDP